MTSIAVLDKDRSDVTNKVDLLCIAKSGYRKSVSNADKQNDDYPRSVVRWAYHSSRLIDDDISFGYWFLDLPV